MQIDRAADLLDVGAHHIHADAASGNAGDIRRGREARHENEIADLGVRLGGDVALAGQVALDKSGNLVGKDDFAAQVKQTFENLKAAVEAAGGDFNNVIKLNYYCVGSVDSSQLPLVREIRDKYVNTADPPTSTFVFVQRLVRPEWLIEVDAVAVVKK